MTAVIPGNRHPHTAFQAFVTVVAALFQELGSTVLHFKLF